MLLAKELVVHLVLELLRVEHAVGEIGLVVHHVVLMFLGNLLLPCRRGREGQHRLARQRGRIRPFVVLYLL